MKKILAFLLIACAATAQTTAIKNPLFQGTASNRPAVAISAKTASWAASPGYDYKVAAFTSSLEITSFGSPVEGSTIVVHLLGANGTAVLTFPSAKRFGQSDAAQTTLTPTAGNHVITFKYIGTTWYFTDTVAATVQVSEGGTGLTTTTAYSPLFSGTTATGAHKADTGPGTSGYVLTSNGAGSYPTWQAATGGTKATLCFAPPAFTTPNDATTYYFGAPAITPDTNADIKRMYIPVAGTINKIYVFTHCVTAGSNESWEMVVRLNNATDTSIGSVALSTQTRVWSNTSLGLVVAAGDYFEIKTTTPTWATNPATIRMSVVAVVE